MFETQSHFENKRAFSPLEVISQNPDSGRIRNPPDLLLARFGIEDRAFKDLTRPIKPNNLRYVESVDRKLGDRPVGMIVCSADPNSQEITVAHALDLAIWNERKPYNKHFIPVYDAKYVDAPGSASEFVYITEPLGTMISDLDVDTRNSLAPEINKIKKDLSQEYEIPLDNINTSWFYVQNPNDPQPYIRVLPWPFFINDAGKQIENAKRTAADIKRKRQTLGF